MALSAETFRRLLYADLSLAEVLASMNPKADGVLADSLRLLRKGEPGPAEVALATSMATRPDEVTAWHHLLMAGIQVARERPERAISALQRGLAHRKTDARTRLFMGNALSALGAAPDPVVEGVVVDVPSQGGRDTLAAYTDGSVRYLVSHVARFVWDVPDGRLDAPVRAVMAAADQSLADFSSERPQPAEGLALQAILTRGGLRFRQESVEALGQGTPGTPLFAAATRLLTDVLALTGWA